MMYIYFEKILKEYRTKKLSIINELEYIFNLNLDKIY